MRRDESCRGLTSVQRVQLGSAEPTDDEEGRSALCFGDLRLDPVGAVGIDRLKSRFGFAGVMTSDPGRHALFCLIWLASFYVAPAVIAARRIWPIGRGRFGTTWLYGRRC